MNNGGENRVLYNIVSPYGLAIISYASFLLSVLIPPSFYTQHMHEPDLVFLDPMSITFYTLCVCGFLAGLYLIEWLYAPIPCIERVYRLKANPALFLLLPLSAGVLLSLISSVLLIRQNPLLIAMLVAQQGTALRNDAGIEIEGTLNSSVLFLTGVIWWALWRSYQFGVEGQSRRIVKFGLVLAVMAVFVSSSLNISRHALMVVTTGLAISYLLRKAFLRQLNWRLVGKTVLTFVIGGVFFFSLVLLLRGGLGGAGKQFDMFLGYTVASYNRLAALLQGRLHYEYSGRGIYLSNFISFSKIFNHIIPFGRVMNVPNYLDWWGAEFSSVGIAGLDASMIFCGAFGEIFTDIGWFAPIYLVGYGVLYGLVWRWVKEGRMAGILLYPYFAYCILFWFTTNGLFDQDIVALIIVAIILSAYEVLFVRQCKHLVEVPQKG